MDRLEDFLVTTAFLPNTDEEIDAWLKERGIPDFEGKYLLFAEVHSAVSRGLGELRRPTLPPGQFRFLSSEVEMWYQNAGTAFRLLAGIDFPEDLDRKVIRRRLQQAAWYRGGQVRVWFDGPDVCFVFVSEE